MRELVLKFLCAFLSASFFIMFLMFCAPSTSSAEVNGEVPPDVTAMPGKPSPIISGVSVQPIGDSMIQIRLRGREMPLPHPVSAPGADVLVIRFDGVKFPQVTDKRDWWEDYEWDVLRLAPPATDKWWKEYPDYFVLNRITAEPTGEGGMKLSFTSSKPLVIDIVKGLAGNDTLTIVLKAYTPPVVTELKAKLLSLPNDPMSVKTPFTLNLKDADSKSVFRLLAEFRKYNLLIDPSVPEMIIPAINFRGIPFNEAFAYLLRMTDLNYSMNGNTLIIGRAASLGKTLGKEVVRSYRINYAIEPLKTDPGKIDSANSDPPNRGGIKDSINYSEGKASTEEEGKGLAVASGTKVLNVNNEDSLGDDKNVLSIVRVILHVVPLSKIPQYDVRNRTLYVTATPDQHEEVAALLKRLDHPGRQVMLQARIVEVKDEATQELETLVGAVYDQWLMSFSGGRLNFGYNYNNVGFSPLEPGESLIPIGGGNGTWYGMTMNNMQKALTAGLNAMERDGKGKTLAHPSIITVDGEKSVVSMLQKILYFKGHNSDTGDPENGEVNVGPLLAFTPVIGRDDVITIGVTISTGTLISWTEGASRLPITASRNVETVVRVRNGEPFVVGGLYQDIKTSNRSRIPVLGYIPLLGDLFTTRNDTHDKTEVAMIVIPYILDVPDGETDTFDLSQPSLSK
ncbi:type II and III secretion system protein [Synergistales bacterium]|nr:type II and III secretion system protein [Synergistales bacterium]